MPFYHFFWEGSHTKIDYGKRVPLFQLPLSGGPPIVLVLDVLAATET